MCPRLRGGEEGRSARGCSGLRSGDRTRGPRAPPARRSGETRIRRRTARTPFPRNGSRLRSPGSGGEGAGDGCPAPFSGAVGAALSRCPFWVKNTKRGGLAPASPPGTPFQRRPPDRLPPPPPAPPAPGPRPRALPAVWGDAAAAARAGSVRPMREPRGPPPLAQPGCGSEWREPGAGGGAGHQPGPPRANPPPGNPPPPRPRRLCSPRGPAGRGGTRGRKPESAGRAGRHPPAP